MATQVNWGMPDLPSPGGEIAGITGLLESIETARESKRRFEMKQKLEQQQADQLAQHNAALELQQKQATAAQLEMHRQTMEKDQARLGFDQQKEANAHYGEVQKAIDIGDVPTAQSIGGRYGMKVQPNQPLIEQQAEQARAQRELEGRKTRGAEVADSFSMIPAMPPAVSQAFGGNAREGVGQEPTPEEMQPTPEELHPTLPPVSVKMPVGSTLDYDPGAAKLARGQERGRQQQKFMESHAEEIRKDKVSEQAALETVAMMGNEGFKEDPDKVFAARRQHIEDQNRMDARAKESAQSRATPRPPNPQSEQRINQAARKMVGSETLKWAKDNGIPDFKVAYGKASEAANLMSKGAPPAQAAAIESFVRAAKGGMVTGYAQTFMTKHLGGLIDRLENQVQEWKDGGYGDEFKVNMMESLKNVQDAIKEEVETRHQAFVDEFYSPGNENMHATIDDIHAGMFGPFGYQTDRWQGAKGINAQGEEYVAPGKQRPGGGAPSAAPSGGQTPINILPPRGPTGGDEMRVMPTGTPLAAAAAGTGGGPGGPGDPALMTKARTQEMYRQQQAERAARAAQKKGGGGKAPRRSIDDWVTRFADQPGGTR